MPNSRLLSFHTTADPTSRFGVINDAGTGVVELGDRTEFRSLLHAVQSDALSALGTFSDLTTDHRLEDIVFDPPLGRPGKIFCIGVNYGGRSAEYEDKSDAAWPSVFVRFPDSFTGHERDVLRPPESPQLDYEGEIVAVIGKGGRRIPRSEARDHIAGLALGNEGTIRLYLDRSVPALPGDRFILRESGRSQTVGGGQFLDVDPVLRAKDADPSGDPERVITERGWIDADLFNRLTGERRDPNVGRWIVSQEAAVEREAIIRDQVQEAGDLGLDAALLGPQERALIDLIGDIIIEEGRVTIGKAVSPFSDHPWLGELAAAPFQPPAPDHIDRAEVRAMVRQGLVVETDGLYFSPDAIERMAELLRTRLAEEPDGVTVADVRDMLGTSRKYVLALLAHFDKNGRTRRRDDYRIAGPRL